MPPDAAGYRREKKGKFHKTQRKIKHTIDDAKEVTEWVVGDVTETVAATGAKIKKEASFILDQTAGVTRAVTDAASFVESGLVQVTTTGVHHEVGTEFAGMKFGASVGLKFNPATCAEMGKFVQDTMKLCSLVKKVVDKLKAAVIVPGLGDILKEMDKLMKIQVPCVDVAAGASASIAAQSPVPSVTILPVDTPPP